MVWIEHLHFSRGKRAIYIEIYRQHGLRGELLFGERCNLSRCTLLKCHVKEKGEESNGWIILKIVLRAAPANAKKKINGRVCLTRETMPETGKGSGVQIRRELGVDIGSMERYRIRWSSDNVSDPQPTLISLKIRNAETAAKNLLYLRGPYSIYIQVLPTHFSEVLSENPEPQDPYLVQTTANLHPGTTFSAVLSLNGNSQILETVYEWRVDILSQALLSESARVRFTLSVNADSGVLSAACTLGAHLWNRPPPEPEKPAHLVILTHGVYLNVQCDLLYLKETLEQSSNSNTLFRGYPGNITHTEKGVKWLGINLANYIDGLLNESPWKIDRISFVGHSLGGVVQTFAINYLLNFEGFRTRKLRLKDVKPVNFVTLALPLLGTQSEFANYINMGLEVGSLGKTGKDLSLRNRYFSKFLLSTHSQGRLLLKPLLEVVPLDLKLHFYLKCFNQRVVFANAVNDGIVPLKTSALLYLDYRSLDVIEKIRHGQKVLGSELDSSKDKIGVIPDSGNEETEFQSETEKDPVNGPKIEKPTRPSKSLTILPPFLQRPPSFALAKQQRIKRISTVPADDSTNSRFYAPPQSSPIISAINVLLAPAPKNDFFEKFRPIQDPSFQNSLGELNAPCPPSGEASEYDVIVHDKVYTYDELPEPYLNKISGVTRRFSKIPPKMLKEDILETDKNDIPFLYKLKKTNYLVKKHFKSKQLAEKIARLYHFDKLWRKILVNLKPDAHNNIIVRRQFVNSYGWNVINYLAGIFDYQGKSDGEFEKLRKKIESLESVYYDPKLSSITDHFNGILGVLKKKQEGYAEEEFLESELESDTEIDDMLQEKACGQ